MIICQCNVITSGDLKAAVGELRAGDAHAVVTPAGVFRCCGKRPRCGTCMPLVTGLIQEELAPAQIRQ
jgi:bacterioferritin-associated ferredoxin